MVNPATSLSVVVAVTVWLATESKSLSDMASITAMVIVELMLPSMMLSSTPVTVAVCAVFQLAFVNVRLSGDTDNSPVSLLEIEITTSVVG